MWSRVDGPLPNGITTDGGLLKIVNAQLYHGGPYVCNVTNKVGSVQSEIVVLVQGSYILLKYITLLVYHAIVYHTIIIIIIIIIMHIIIIIIMQQQKPQQK